MTKKTEFRAVFDNGVIIEWHRPQTWRNVFQRFKFAGALEGHGVLFCGDVLLRETGTREEDIADE